MRLSFSCVTGAGCTTIVEYSTSVVFYATIGLGLKQLANLRNRRVGNITRRMSGTRERSGRMVAPVNQNDPRVKRTRQLLQRAFVDLIHEKSFEAITVQDIAERATLNRATF
jgi:hypothetical protein